MRVAFVVLAILAAGCGARTQSATDVTSERFDHADGGVVVDRDPGVDAPIARDVIDLDEPVEVLPSEPHRLVAGLHYTCFVESVDTRWCWGHNATGVSGGADAGMLVQTPLRQHGIESVAVEAGYVSLLLRTAEGHLYARGEGRFLADVLDGGTRSYQHVLLPAWSGSTGHVATGFVLCGSMRGEWRCAGMPRGALISNLVDAGVASWTAPTIIPGMQGVARMAMSDYHLCGVTRDGAVVCGGRNTSGECGRPPSESVPVARVAGLPPTVEVGVGERFSCARTSRGEVWCWGSNVEGQLEDGTRIARAEPRAVVGLDDATSLAVKGWSACAVRRGRVWCWGYPQRELSSASFPNPTLREIPGLTDVEELVLGASHACVLTRGRQIYCWGDRSQGQVGDGEISTTPRATPYRLDIPAP